MVVAAGILTMARAPSDGRVSAQEDLDPHLKSFLDSNRGRWRDMNVPAVDGQPPHDIIVKNKYTQALEIGTSTGPSGIWIAWLQEEEVAAPPPGPRRYFGRTGRSIFGIDPVSASMNATRSFCSSSVSSSAVIRMSSVGFFTPPAS